MKTKIADLEKKLKLNEERFERLLNILQYKATSIQDLLDYALNEAIDLTKSQIGYIYHYDDATKLFTLNTWSRDVMKQCTIQEPRTTYQLEKTGIWGEAVRQGKPLIVNNFESPHPLKKGYPKGHAKLLKYMTIPVKQNDRIVAVVGVANKKENYNEEDVRQLTLFMVAVWMLVGLKKAEEELNKKTEELSKLNRFFVGREAKMAELKAEIRNLKD